MFWKRASKKFRNVGRRALLAAVAVAVPAAWPGARAVIPGCCKSFGSVTVMQASTGAIVRSLKTGPAGNYQVAGVGIALTNHGTRAAVVSYTVTSTKITYVLTLVDLHTGAVTGPLTIPGVAQSIAVNPKSGVIYVVYVQSGKYLEAVDPTDLTVIANSAVNDAQGALAVAADGQKIFVGSPNGVEAISAAKLMPIGFVALAGAATALASSPDSSTLYAAYGTDSLAIINIQGLQVTHTISNRALREVSAIAVSSDGSQLYVSANTSISTVATSTFSISTVTLPFGGNSMALAPGSPIYLGQTSTDGSPSVLVFDPVSQIVTATYAAPGTGFLAISQDGGQLYHLAFGSAPVSATGMVPSMNITGSGITGAPPGVGAYDALDDLLLVPDYLGNVNVIAPETMQVKSLLTLSTPLGFVLYGNTGYALTGVGSPPNTNIVQFDPVSLKVTGQVSIPYPANDNSGYYTQPAANEHFVYVPFNFYYSPCCDVRAASGGINYGIAVLNTQTMSLQVWPYPVSNILGFSIAQGTGLGYLSVGRGANAYALMEINLQNGHVQKTVTLGVAGSLVSSPDGSTLYLAAQFASGSGYGALYSIDRQTMTVTNSTAGVYAEDLSVSPDGQYLYGPTGTGTAGAVNIVSTASLQLVGKIPSVGVPPHVIFVNQ